jgi:CRP-like cAMP-binding protein
MSHPSLRGVPDEPRAVALLACPWFAGSTAREVEDYAQRSTLARLRQGEVLYATGDPPASFFILLSGRLGAWRKHPDGRFSALYFIADEPNTVLCVENIIADIPYFAIMAAMDDGTRVVSVPADVLYDALRAHPDQTMKMATHIARRLQAFTEQAVDLSMLDVPGRLAKYLVTHLERRSMVVSLGLSQVELALRLGASRQSINRALSSFTQRGYIESLGGGAYRILNPAKLLALSESAFGNFGSEKFR